MHNTQAQPLVVRRAAAADAAALARLREVMLSDMGMLATGADPQYRRRGYARACLEALLAWFRDETEARVINLNATGEGIALYRSLGFTEPRYPVLQLRTVRRGL
jgi:GNAT superfamily N-acetyltransferase